MTKSCKGIVLGIGIQLVLTSVKCLINTDKFIKGNNFTITITKTSCVEYRKSTSIRDGFISRSTVNKVVRDDYLFWSSLISTCGVITTLGQGLVYGEKIRDDDGLANLANKSWFTVFSFFWIKWDNLELLITNAKELTVLKNR